MQKKYYKILFILGIVLLVFLAIFFAVNKNNISVEDKSVEKIQNQEKIQEQGQVKNTENKTNTQITMTMGEEQVVLDFNSGLSLYDVFLQAKKGSDLSFEGKKYPGLGFFVTDIETLHSGGGKDLVYYINDIEAEVGISAYVPKDGDIIRWELE